MTDFDSERQPEGDPGISAEALGQALEALLKSPQAPSPEAAEAVPAGTDGVCPEPGEWLGLAMGQAGAAKVDGLMAHAAVCRACAARLRQSMRILEEEAAEEEAAEVAQLASVAPDWQRKLAIELARTPRKSLGGKTLSRYLWAGAAMAAALTMAAGVALWWQHVTAPERLLAEAYTHSRIFVLRLPGADFAEVTPETHLRGGATGHESTELLDARAGIQRHLERTPNDPHWLQLEARADLLEENYGPAIDILDRLLDAGPVTAGLLADDAAAYFQRGAATGSENDRATALEYLRRADELTPGDPVVLFNEAVAMEDRGQVMNAVETWNRYLHFERDPRWLAEGRSRLQALEQKLIRLKSHQSRMDQHLATPQAMRALAADGASLRAIDEELSSALLPKLLDSAYPLPVDRSRGSPCEERCLAARTLLQALAASLERNHQDPWLTQFLPSVSTQPTQDFIEAVQALGKAIAADIAGDYLPAQKWAMQAQPIFRRLGNSAGEDRSQVELAFAFQRFSDHAACYRTAHALLGRNPQFAWIQIHALTEDTECMDSPGAASENNPNFLRVIGLAQDRHYTLLEMRGRNLLGNPAVDNGDAESSWSIFLPSLRKFYEGDYPAWRLYTTLSGLEEVEEGTPRIQLALLMEREAMGVLELSPARQLIPSERLKLAAAALRAGSISESQQQMKRAQEELAANGSGQSVNRFLAESELTMANIYLVRHDLSAAAQMLDAADRRLTDTANYLYFNEIALGRGELQLALGHPESAEPMLREALIGAEKRARKKGAENVPLARQDRDLYAVLAGVWLAQGRSGEDVLALWERYRLRILDRPVSACPDKGLTCLRPQLSRTLRQLGPDQVFGQVVLLDRVLSYRADAQGVVWNSVAIGKDDVLAAAVAIEHAASSPATTQDSVDRAARRAGGVLLGGLSEPSAATGQLLIESDPLLGNLPWPAVATAAGPLGLRFDLAEVPSLLLSPKSNKSSSNESSTGNAFAAGSGPLVVGASLASGENGALPEVLEEAKAVARFGLRPNVLLGAQATGAQVASHLGTASAIHFAGHATEVGGATRMLLASSAAATPGANSLSAGLDSPYLDSAVLRKHPPRFARLVVFSACSTGRKEEGWNHGMDDIVDTLAGLGVPEVVATRWQIDSFSAVPLMDAFYGGLAQGASVSHALTAARQALARDVRYRHPYYWAAYYASGSERSGLNLVFRAAK